MSEGGTLGLIIAPYRTDGFYMVSNTETIRTTEWLRRSCQTLGEVDVSQEIVDFAVKSECERQCEVEDIAVILNAMVATMSPDGWQEPASLMQALTQNPREDPQ